VRSVTAIILAWGILNSSSAVANGLHFCNQTGEDVYVAVSINSPWKMSPSDQCGGGNTYMGTNNCLWVKGWWQVHPGECLLALPGLSRDNSYSYYASTSNREKIWSSDKDGNADDRRCIDPAAFNYDDGHALACSNPVGFVPIQVEAHDDFTVTLALQ
jgi:uncharacterized membrane protein